MLSRYLWVAMRRPRYRQSVRMQLNHFHQRQVKRRIQQIGEQDQHFHSHPSSIDLKLHLPLLRFCLDEARFCYSNAHYLSYLVGPWPSLEFLLVELPG